MLGDFFDRVSSATFDSGDYLFDKAIPPPGFGDLQFGWGDGLPPTLHGTSTSLSHGPVTATNLQEIHHDGRSGHYGVSPSYRAASTSDDVLAAAALLQNGHAQLAHSMSSPEAPVFATRHASHDFAQTPLINPPLRRQSSQTYAGRHHGMQRPPTHSLHPRANSVDVTDSYYPDLIYGGPRRTHSGPPGAMHHQSKSVEVRWGSDGSFLDHGYVAPANQETEDDVTTDMMQTMVGMLPQASAKPRGSTSVVRQRPRGRTNGMHEMGKVESDEGSDEQDRVNPRSPRKRKVKDEEEEEDDGSESAGQVKRRKKLATNGRSGRPRKMTSTSEDVERDRSLSAGQKANRENLTEEQKRSNHILSEQKRRNLIKQGFDDLCELVPDLKGGGYSKSAMLVQAADWLEDMLKGNDELKAVLASMDGRH